MLIMFLTHYSNIALFYHTHTIDGVTYCHSHFYRNSKSSLPVQQLPHSKDQLKLIQDFNHITWTYETYMPCIEKPEFSFYKQELNKLFAATVASTLQTLSDRAPPAKIV